MLRIDFRSATLVLVAGVCAIALVPGCERSPRSYQPSTISARGALEAALATWERGGDADELESASPPVHVLDFQWQAGLVLEGYEILEEEPGEGESEKRFSVLLKMKKTKGEKRARYIILRQGPIWVFREEDYARTSNMGDNPGSRRPARVR